MKGDLKLTLEVDNVTKVYGNRFSRIRVRALNKFSISLVKGEVVCVKGRNGSGKSTLLRLITGLIHPTSGRIRIKFDENASNLSPRVGYCPDNPFIYPNVTISTFLRLISSILQRNPDDSHLEEFLGSFSLVKWRDEPIGSLSKGMLHKVALIASMIDQPQLLVLDEPFSSLDESSAIVLMNNIQRLSSQGSTIIFADLSSDRSEEISDRIVDLDEAKVVL